jgi:hypothetical protein
MALTNKRLNANPSLVRPPGNPVDTSAPAGYGGDKTSEKPAPEAGEIDSGSAGLRDPGFVPSVTATPDHNAPSSVTLGSPALAGSVVPSGHNVPSSTSAVPPARPAPDASLNPGVAPPFAKSSLL